MSTEERLDQITSRIGTQLNTADTRLDQIITRLDGIDRRLDAIDQNLLDFRAGVTQTLEIIGRLTTQVWLCEEPDADEIMGPLDWWQAL